LRPSPQRSTPRSAVRRPDADPPTHHRQHPRRPRRGPNRWPHPWTPPELPAAQGHPRPTTPLPAHRHCARQAHPRRRTAGIRVRHRGLPLSDTGGSARPPDAVAGPNQCPELRVHPASGRGSPHDHLTWMPSLPFSPPRTRASRSPGLSSTTSQMQPSQRGGHHRPRPLPCEFPNHLARLVHMYGTNPNVCPVLDSPLTRPRRAMPGLSHSGVGVRAGPERLGDKPCSQRVPSHCYVWAGP